MSLEAPSVAVVDELVSVEIVLINNQKNEVEAEVIMPSSGQFAIVRLDKHQNYRATRVRSTLQHRVNLAAFSSRKVPIPIVASEAGLVRVLVIGRCLAAQKIRAQIERTIEIDVQASGVPIVMYTNHLIDLRQQAELTNYFNLNGAKNFKNAKATICFIGDVVGVPQLTNNSNKPIDYASLGKLKDSRKASFRF